MSAAGSREEMLEALQKARQAMSRRVPTPTAGDSSLHAHGADVASPSPPPRPRPPAPSEAKDNRGHFFSVWCRRLDRFVADPTKTTLELPPDLSPNDRRELHALAEKYNLSHHSRGVGAARQLVLKKDALHYRMPDARPDDIEAMVQSASGKQSKYHLRRVVPDGEAAAGSIGAFADEATADMVRRLDRATDEYRKAVEVGYSHEELLALESGESVEDMLRRGDKKDLFCIAGSDEVLHGVTAPLTSAPTVANGGGEAPHGGKIHESGKGKLYDEVCLRCGTRAHVDYDVQKWECNGYCAQCAAQTIWKLMEVEETVTESLVHSSPRVDRKRGRQASELEIPPNENEPEEIDRDNDEDDTITVEDVVDMASMNDYCAADINWIRRFATHHKPQDSLNVLSRHIVFCIEFEDLFSMRIFRDFLTSRDKNRSGKEQKRLRDDDHGDAAKDDAETNHTAWFLRLSEVKEAGVPLSTLLEELSACIPGQYDSLAVAFPNMSVYGTATTCVCLVRSGEVEESSLGLLQRKYGQKNVCFARELHAVLSDNLG